MGSKAPKPIVLVSLGDNYTYEQKSDIANKISNLLEPDYYVLTIPINGNTDVDVKVLNVCDIEETTIDELKSQINIELKKYSNEHTD